MSRSRPDRPADFASVVRAHWRDTQGYVVTGSPPCIRVAEDEVENVERRLRAVTLADAPGLLPSGSWFLAVLVCPGDDLGPLAAWAAALPTDARGRIHFYLHADADAVLLAPWRDAGLPLLNVHDGIRDWMDLHKVLGWDLNLRVYDDHA